MSETHYSGDKIEIFVRKESAVVPTLVFTVRGRLDYYNATSFQTFLRGRFGPGPLWIVLDLAGLVHLASSGINTLVELSEEVAPLPGHFVVVAVPPAIRQWMALLGLDEKLGAYGSVKDALDDLGQPESQRKFRPLFPTTVPCPSCGKKLQVQRQGTFRCSTCKMPFLIDDRVRVTLV